MMPVFQRKFASRRSAARGRSRKNFLSITDSRGFIRWERRDEKSRRLSITWGRDEISLHRDRADDARRVGGARGHRRRSDARGHGRVLADKKRDGAAGAEPRARPERPRASTARRHRGRIIAPAMPRDPVASPVRGERCGDGGESPVASAPPRRASLARRTTRIVLGRAPHPPGALPSAGRATTRPSRTRDTITKSRARGVASRITPSSCPPPRFATTRTATARISRPSPHPRRPPRPPSRSNGGVSLSSPAP